MTMDEWREQLERIPALWRSAKALTDATTKAWFDELGRFTNRDLFEAVLTRLALSDERAPGLAKLAQEVRDAGGSRSVRKDDGPENPEDRERWNRIGRDWSTIISCLHDEAFAAIYWALMGAASNAGRAAQMALLTPTNVTTDPGDMRLVLLDEIRERKIVPARPKAPVGGLVPISAVLSAA